jgi:hypothetical protein
VISRYCAAAALSAADFAVHNSSWSQLSTPSRSSSFASSSTSPPCRSLMNTNQGGRRKASHSTELVLVCSAWRSISQALLWEYVYLEGPAAMAAFVQAPRLPIKTLHIFLDDSEGSEQVFVPLERILDGVRGVRELHITDMRTMDPARIPAVFKLDFVSGEGFKGELPRIRSDLVLIARFADLKWLELYCVQVALENPSLILLFDLEHLSIRINDDAPIPCSRPLATLCQPSIHSLELSWESTFKPILRDLLPLAQQLHTLTLRPGWTDESCVPTFLRACGTLQRLEGARLVQGWL